MFRICYFCDYNTRDHLLGVIKKRTATHGSLFIHGRFPGQGAAVLMALTWPRGRCSNNLIPKMGRVKPLSKKRGLLQTVLFWCICCLMQTCKSFTNKNGILFFPTFGFQGDLLAFVSPQKYDQNLAKTSPWNPQIKDVRKLNGRLCLELSEHSLSYRHKQSFCFWQKGFSRHYLNQNA